MCYRESTLMRDSLHIPPTALLHRGQNQTPQLCNILLPTAPGFSSHSPLACPERRGVARHCTKNRYTCRTKSAVSLSTSSKLPNLIDTEFDPAARRPLHVRSCCVRRAEHRGAKDLAAFPLPSHVTWCYMPAPATRISRHLCRDIFRVSPIPSTKPPKYLGTFSDIRSAVYVPHAFAGPGCLSRAEQRLPAEAGERGTALQKGALSISSITVRQTARIRDLA